jgi:hypothetical protein
LTSERSLIKADGMKQQQVTSANYNEQANMYTIPAAIWTDPTRYRTGGEALLFEIILEGWIVQQKRVRRE